MGAESKLHFSFFFKAFARVLKPGRVVIVHCCQIPRMKRAGEQKGMHDFRGLLIRLGERAGLVYEYDWCIRKNPQALKNGTGVWTPDGIKPIESLVIGSKVLGSDGKPTTVLGVWPHQQKEMYRVTFSDGESIECDGNHLWSVNSHMSRYGSKQHVLKTEDMYKKGALLPNGKTARWAVPLCRQGVEFTETSDKELPLDPYFLGVLLGDGILSSRGVVGVCTREDVAESIPLPPLHYAAKLKNSERGNHVAAYHFRCEQWHRNDILNACRELGVHGKRAWEKEIPASYLYASRDSRLALLQGLMDTDGTVKKNKSCYFSSTSFNLAKGVQFLTESLGGICRISCQENPRYEYKGEVRYGRTQYICCVRLPDTCPFRFNKKKKSRWKPQQKTIHRRIVRIEKTGHSSDCTCITVDAEDGLFLTEHAIVTHNSQAIRTRSRELQFAGLEKDRAKSRGALADYLIKFTAPGDNEIPIQSENQVTRNNWIDWAEPAWLDIKETDTYNTDEAKSEEDTVHICPLQREVIRRLVLLYSNPGEIVFSPFAGIGSELRVALKLGRKAYGCELKPEWHQLAVKRCGQVQAEQSAPSLF